MKPTRTALLALVVAATCLITSPEDAQTNAVVKPSGEIKNTVGRFYQRMRAGDMAGFDEFISTAA